MKLIINCSTLSGSGVTQVAISFIYECRLFIENEYHIFLSKTVSSQFQKNDFPDNFKFYEFSNHPTKFKGGFKTVQKLKEFEKVINPDVVFSVFGPSWWTPKAPHLIGYAYPHYVYPESPLFKIISLKEKIKISLFKKIHIFFLKRNAKYFVSETTDVSTRLQSLITGLPSQNFFTVGNTCNNFFRDYQETNESNILPKKDINEFRFLSLCTFHIHKNLGILNKVIPILNRELLDKKIKFVLTIDEKIFNEKFSEEAKNSIINIGRINVRDCPQLYTECDALFLPTLLECFSANYPEAMIMSKPIATSNLTFASTVCGNAALYFDPLDENDIVGILMKIFSEKSQRSELTQNGRKKINDFPTASERAVKYLEICHKIAKS